VGGKQTNHVVINRPSVNLGQFPKVGYQIRVMFVRPDIQVAVILFLLHANKSKERFGNSKKYFLLYIQQFK
jgi:hypothetical protein